MRRADPKTGRRKKCRRRTEGGKGNDWTTFTRRIPEAYSINGIMIVPYGSPKETLNAQKKAGKEQKNGRR